jgi:hypothetical protein
MTPHQPGDWQNLAQQASTEMDPTKLMELASELNRVLGEREETSASSNIQRMIPSPTAHLHRQV